jgi:putative addiction module component (TIGR02574 family)
VKDADQLLKECLQLEPNDRARLIDELQASLPPDLAALPPEWPNEYRDEVVRRVQSVIDGSARTVSPEEFFARLKIRT